MNEETDEIVHKPWCTSLLDDESDYEYLADAGECCCGAIKYEL
jgi:hypothetical protein